MSLGACSSVFLVPQYLSFTSLPSFLQHGTNLISGSAQQLPQKLDVTSFFAFGENICRHRRSLDPLEACLVAGQALLDHAELNSETFVLRRLAWHRQRGEHLPGSCTIVHAQGFCRLGIVFRIQRDRISLRKVHRTTLGTCQCVPDMWRKLHTQLQENFS